MINTHSKLLELIGLITDEPILGLDTEFVRRNTYYPILCLIQLSTPTQQYAVDVLAIEDLSPLFDKLYDHNTTWIVHSASQDLEALHDLSQRLPKNLFDTQTACNLLGYAPQISYQALCKTLLNIDIDKTHTCFDWQKRPLPTEVLDYALNDVKHLFTLYHKLKQQLTDANKQAWLLEETQYLINQFTHSPPFDTQWQKLSGINKLPKQYYPQAQQLSAWRLQTAIKHNKPKKWIIDDLVILNLAQNKTQLFKQWQADFKQFAQKNPLADSLSLESKKLTPSEQKQYKSLRLKLEKIANKSRLSTQIISNKNTLIQLIKGNTNTRLHQGWRYTLLQDLL